MKSRTRVAGVLLLTYTTFLSLFYAAQYVFMHLNHHELETNDFVVPIHLNRHLLQTNGTANANCTPAGIEQFPRPLMSQEARRHGAVIIHIFICLYIFLALAVICDEYFVPSLERLCEVLNIKSDVAGATFMAAGSSAPELATAIFAVFLTKDDIGVGTVVGSAVYNIAFVVSVCGLFAGRVVFLNWWPLFRDSLFYCISIIALLLSMSDQRIDWMESLIFLLLYVLYIVFMFVNDRVENYVVRIPALACLQPKHKKESLSLMAYKNIPESESDTVYTSGGTYMSVQEKAAVPDAQPKVTLHENISADQKLNGAVGETTPQEELSHSVLTMPSERWKIVLWVISLPVLVTCYLTVPDCRESKWRKWFLVTFTLSCVWIGAYSYILVWMITIIGYTFNIPDTVMGLTFLAAGVSVPDAISSLLVAKEGLGDMAISNAVGSNVFDILVCLGVPWFLQTAIISPGSSIPVYSEGLVYTTVSLLATVFFLLVITHINGWKLDRKYGAIMMVWYLLFMVFATMYQLNVFGNFTLPTCPSDY